MGGSRRLVLATAVLAVVAPASLPAADRSVHYALRLTANNEPFLRVDVGKTVFVHARLSPMPSKREGLFKDVAIRQRAAGSSVSQTVRICPASQVSGCLTFPTSRAPATFYYQAFLFDTSGNPKLLAKSAVVTVKWVGELLPTETAIEVNGATRGENIETGALTCAGSGFSEGTSCYVYAAPGSTIPARATLDRQLPAGWTWTIVWEPYGGSQTFNCTGKVCDASIAVPALGGTIHSHLTKPGGYNDAAMYVVACKTGETPYAGHPCPF